MQFPFKRAPRPVGLDLFAGAGGMSLGFEQAGFDVKAAVEIDPIHCGVHAFNFPNCAIIPKSVANLDAKEIGDVVGTKVDVVFGGAPCQGFSMIGKRVIDDPRNSLVKDFVRIVRDLDAGYFVFENVKGLTVGNHRKFLDEIYEEFDKIGYQVAYPWRVLNAADFGVPQNRERLILIGAKNGMALPVYPYPTHVRPGIHDNILGDVGPTCRDALDDLPDAETFKTLEVSDSVETMQWGMPSDYAAEMRCLLPDHWHFAYRRDWDPSLLTSSMRSAHSIISRTRFSETAHGAVEPISRFFRLPPDGLSNTLRAGTDGARGAFTSPRPIHYRYPRCITVREMARLHSFPDWFRMHSTKWHGARQVGNAVPPALARVVATAVINAMGITPIVPMEVLKLRDPKVLEMDLSAAADYWGVDRPPSKRNQKSGARKRKQIDIEVERLAARI